MFRNPAIFSMILLTGLFACSGTSEEAQRPAEQSLSDPAESEAASLPDELQTEAVPEVSSPPTEQQEEFESETVALESPPLLNLKRSGSLWGPCWRSAWRSR